MIAAEKTGRRAHVLELDPLYCDTIICRWQTVTGKCAEHIESGQSFEELEEIRLSERGTESAETTGDGDLDDERFDP